MCGASLRKSEAPTIAGYERSASQPSRLTTTDTRITLQEMEKLEEYRAAWSFRWAAEAEQAKSRANVARARASEIAGMLRQDFAASGVWLIGSLARGEFRLDSDIDLVVEGIAPGRFFAACARAQALAGDVEVDLAPREDLRPRARRALAEEGLAL